MFKSIIIGLVILTVMGIFWRMGSLATGLPPWTPQVKQEALSGHKKVFVHFTGEGCMSCKVQWSKVDLVALKQLAAKTNTLLYEANLVPGNANNTFITQELSRLNLGGVPAYITLSSKGEWVVLEPTLYSPPDISKALLGLK